MCVRDLTRGKCQASRRMTSKTDFKSEKALLLAKPSVNRRSLRRTKLREEMDLLCTELLGQSNSCTAFESDPKYEPPLSPLLMTDAAFSTISWAAAMDPHQNPFLLSPMADYIHFEHIPCNSSGLYIDRLGPLPSVLTYGTDTSDNNIVDDGDHGAVAGDNDGLGGADWHGHGHGHDLSPGQLFNLPEENQKCLGATTSLSVGNSLQSNLLSVENWPVTHGGPPCLDKKWWSGESMASSRYDGRKPEFKVDSVEGCQHSSGVYEPNNSFDPEAMNVCIPKEFEHEKEFRETMEFLLKKESAINYQLSTAYIERLTGTSGQKLRDARRNFVNWILKVVERLDLSSLTAAHAVSLFDRSLSQDVENSTEDLMLAAIACVWIAAKLEDSCSPHLSCIRAIAGVNYDDEQIRQMEVLILTSLEWRMLGVTAADFLANMISQLPALGVGCDLLTSLGHWSEEIMRGLLQEVEFMAYQPSVVSFSVMQFLLDKCAPVHSTAFMAAFHLAMVVDLDSLESCRGALTKLTSSREMFLPFLNRTSVDFYCGHDYQSCEHTHPDGRQKRNERTSIPVF